MAQKLQAETVQVQKQDLNEPVEACSYLKLILKNIRLKHKDGSLTRGLPAHAGTATGNVKSKIAKTESLQEMDW